MGYSNKYAEEIESYEKNLIEDLTVNDALILIAVCAVKEKACIDNHYVDDTKTIVTMAQNHPIFFDISDSIKPSVNKFMNMIKTTDTVKYVMTAAKALKPGHKETAFTWSAMILMSDGVLTEARKHLLDRYALLLGINNNDAQKILVKWSDQQTF